MLLPPQVFVELSAGGVPTRMADWMPELTRKTNSTTRSAPAWRFCGGKPASTPLIVLGSDYISSGGWRAAFVAGLLLDVVMPLGTSAA